jgi:hypothetical protein
MKIERGSARSQCGELDLEEGVDLTAYGMYDK